MTKIKINNAKFYAYHGVLEYEKEYGNQFEVDIEMDCFLPGLKMTDDLNNTVDYLAVYKLVEKIFTTHKFNLIETVNEMIGTEILNNFDKVYEVTVRVRKPNAPLGIIDNVEIEQKYSRE